MQKFVFGKKLKMSQIFLADKVVPVTFIEAGPCFVTQIKTKEKDGLQAVQIGFGVKKKVKKPVQGHLKNLPLLRYFKEFKTVNLENYHLGDKIDVSLFKIGEKIQIKGISKGKGFAGVVKRHHFKGSPATHGHKDQLRMPGSIGSTGPQRVVKGKKMPGRMGGEKVTVKNLEVIKIIPQKNLLIVKGAVPGAKNSWLEIKTK